MNKKVSSDKSNLVIKAKEVILVKEAIVCARRFACGDVFYGLWFFLSKSCIWIRNKFEDGWVPPCSSEIIALSRLHFSRKKRRLNAANNGDFYDILEKKHRLNATNQHLILNSSALVFCISLLGRNYQTAQWKRA